LQGVNKELYAYVHQAMVSGSSEQEIREVLLGAGYKPEDIHNTLILSRNNIDYENLGTKDSDYKSWIKGYFRRSKKSIATLIGIDLVLIFLSLLEPWPVKLLADSVFGGIPAPGPLEPYTGTFTLLLIVAGMTISIFLMKSLVAVIDDYIATKLSYKLDLAIKSEMYNHIIRLPLYHKERLHKGDYIGRLKSLTGDVSGLVLDSTSNIVESVLTIVGVLTVLLFVNLELTLIGLVIVPLLYKSVRIFSPKIQKNTEEIQGVIGRTNNHIQESIENTETIQSFTDETNQVKTLQSLMASQLKLSIKAMFFNHGFGFTNSLLVILGSTTILVIGGSKILDGTLSLGELFIFINYMQRLYGPVEGLTHAIAQVKKRTVGAERVYEVINDHQEVEDVDQGYQLVNPKGRIRFENVQLDYDGQIVLKDVNLDIKPGSKIGFIGPSGGGKSSLLKMVPKFILPSKGRIYIDDYDISQSSLLSVRQNMSVISQTPQLFSGTILENILLGANDREIVQNQDIENVLVASNSKEFINKMQVGVNTYIGEAGSMLSGGQKQRVSIARGLLKNAPIVIMDEPTSALDSASEDFIKYHLNDITKGKTVLMVTHKLSMLTAMDQVYVVDEGTVKNVDQYGGLDVYLSYLNKHEIN
jgi:ABC-type bacteriocin/lantibiotic exporter with double-glycine peptidase domain